MLRHALLASWSLLLGCSGNIAGVERSEPAERIDTEDAMRADTGLVTTAPDAASGDGAPSDALHDTLEETHDTETRSDGVVERGDPPFDRGPGATNPGGTPRRRPYVVTAGQSNAGFRIDDGKISYGGAWDWPLWSQQSAIIAKSLGAAEAGDLGDRGTEGQFTAVGGCPLMRSTDGGCHFVDDLGSADPAAWTLSDVGVSLARRINASERHDDVVFISWIQGEAEAHALGDISHMRGSRANGGPYDYASAEAWAGHYRDVLRALLPLLRTATKLPKLRMAVQLIANYGGRPDLVRQAQIDAARESHGDIILGNANPWQWYRPNGEDWSHYSGQAYMDLCLETGRVIALALARAGLADTKDGPSYGDFPAIVGTSVVDANVEVRVSNPNRASTLIVPTDAKGGFRVRVDGIDVAVERVELAAPFALRLKLAVAPAANAKVVVTYGTESARPAALGAITDDASTACPAEPEGVVRRNMPLMVKPS